MKRMSRIIFSVTGGIILGLSFVIFAVTTCAKAVLNNAHLADPERPSWTASESRARGTWVCDVSFSPQELT